MALNTHPLLTLRLSMGRTIPPLCACLACYETPFYLCCCYQVHLISSKWLFLAVVDQTKFELCRMKSIYGTHAYSETSNSALSHSMFFPILHSLFGPGQYPHKKSNFNYLHVFSNLHLPKVALLFCSPVSGN